MMIATEKRLNERRNTPHLGTYFTRGIRFQELARWIEQAAPRKLLVMGCGNGYLESLLSDNTSTVSVDIDEDELKIAGALNQDRANRDFRLMSIYEVPNEFAREQFGGVVISEVLEHLQDDVKALQAAHECLASDGTLLVTLPNLHRFQNRFRLWLGRKPKYMSVDHIREYTLRDSLSLVRRAGFWCKRVLGLDFWLPKDPLFRPILTHGSLIRHRIATSRRNLATWFLLECHKR